MAAVEAYRSYRSAFLTLLPKNPWREPGSANILHNLQSLAADIPLVENLRALDTTFPRLREARVVVTDNLKIFTPYLLFYPTADPDAPLLCIEIDELRRSLACHVHFYHPTQDAAVVAQYSQSYWDQSPDEDAPTPVPGMHRAISRLHELVILLDGEPALPPVPNAASVQERCCMM